MRVLLDTNVVVSALIWGGLPDRLIQAAIDGEIELVTSPVLMTELRDVLARPHLAARLTHNRFTVEQAIALYARLAIHVSPLLTPIVIAADPDDDHVLACAVAAQAQLIVSGDKRHLLTLGVYKGVPIVRPGEAVRMIAE